MLDVGYLQYKDDKLPIRISYKTLKGLKAETKKGVEDLGDNMELYEVLLYHSLKVGATYTDVNFTFVKDDMEDILDVCFYDFIAMIPEFFPNGSKKKIPVKK